MFCEMICSIYSLARAGAAATVCFVIRDERKLIDLQFYQLICIVLRIPTKSVGPSAYLKTSKVLRIISSTVFTTLQPFVMLTLCCEWNKLKANAQFALEFN